MNHDTVVLLERPYVEVVDDILTAVVGGVVNEPILFDVKEDSYALAEPAADVRGITGQRTPKQPQGAAPATFTFLKNRDFVFRPDDNAVLWLEGEEAAQPDDDSTFFVDYLRRDARSPLTDINVGSVTRTLSEAIGREIATVYQQIKQAYLAGFVDTATGKSLDLVVAILGVTRKTAEFAVGVATFFRDPDAPNGNVTIASGTVLRTGKGEASFVTTELRTLQRGQARLDVPIRAADGFKGSVGVVPAGAITILAQTITGIGKIANLDPTVLGAEAESDEALRQRAKAVLRAVGEATLAALCEVISDERAKVIAVFDPNGPPNEPAPPGTVKLVVQTEAKRLATLKARVSEKRAAGVLAELVAQVVFIKPRLVAKIEPGRLPSTAAGKQKLVDEIIAAAQSYVDTLSAGAPAEGSALRETILKTVNADGKQIERLTFKDVIVRQTDLRQPGPEALVEGILAAIEATRDNDQDALRAAVTEVVTNLRASDPSASSVPNRGLLRPSGAAEGTATVVTDALMSAGDFKITTPDNTWSIALDMAPSDVVLES